MARLWTDADEAFAQAYRITSTRGRIYGRQMLIECIALRLRRSVTRAEVVEVVDDAAWMRVRAGMVPSAVASDLWDEVLSRRIARTGSAERPAPVPKPAPVHLITTWSLEGPFDGRPVCGAPSGSGSFVTDASSKSLTCPGCKAAAEKAS